MQMRPTVDVGDLPDEIYTRVSEQFTLRAESFICADDVRRNIEQYAPELRQAWEDTGIPDCALILVWS